MLLLVDLDVFMVRAAVEQARGALVGAVAREVGATAGFGVIRHAGARVEFRVAVVDGVEDRRDEGEDGGDEPGGDGVRPKEGDGAVHAVELVEAVADLFEDDGRRGGGGEEEDGGDGAGDAGEEWGEEGLDRDEQRHDSRGDVGAGDEAAFAGPRFHGVKEGSGDEAWQGRAVRPVQAAGYVRIVGIAWVETLGVPLSKLVAFCEQMNGGLIRGIERCDAGVIPNIVRVRDGCQSR